MTRLADHAHHANDGNVATKDNQEHASLTSHDGYVDHDGNDTRDEEESDESFLPPIEELENLILEAYNNMQSDGEFIFLPDEVAQKLHQVAHLMKESGADMSDGEAEEGNQPEPERIEAIGGDDGNAARSLHQDDLQEPEGEEEEREHARKHEQERAARSVKTSPKPALETMFMELPPVLEIDEEGSSDSHSPSADREVGGAPSRIPSSSGKRRPSAIPPPPPQAVAVKSSSSTPTASPMKASPKSAPSPPPSSRLRAPRDSKVSSYEMRREAAQKLKEDKALREQRARDSAKKQREDARRKLEEAHQKQLEEKRERVRRMKVQREQVKTTSGRKPPSSGSK